MLSNMRPSHGFAVGAVIACTAALLAHRFDVPLLLVSPATPPPTPISARVSDNLLKPAPPLPSEPPLSSSDESTDRGILFARQCLALAERDPLAAMEMATTNHLQDVDSGLAASLISQWAGQDFDRAYQWTRTQEPGAWRDDMLARLAYVRAQTDPIAAARLVATDMSASPTRDEAVISVIHQWALRDARGAAFWAQSLPDEILRQRASAEIAGLAAASSLPTPIR